ncbi:DUF3576 domain-containing protein [Loktanella sp. 3ANDIMAR09]|uniref:DUF3576 domain-containing protein n=1 Tax=Loktanella sp. 3ANDIMAR09 TaxID=1225657 RepID=UPI0006F4E094|nr:DUF3576 domain-containing protein [Loktanella sp. 3ANDIMAR09]
MFVALTGCGLLGFGGGASAPAAAPSGPNPYLYNASLQVLSFLPLESANQSTGQIVYGFGRAPGAAQSYRVVATVTGNALDARSLVVDVRSASGAASSEVRRGIEDAIYTRARALRIADLAP